MEVLQIKVLSIVDQTYVQLKAQILEGRYAPGQHLNEVDIASAFGVSRLPVREALQRLAYEGLAQQIPRRGSFVPELDMGKASNVLEVIGSLLALGARKASEDATDEDLAWMRQRLEAVRDEIAQNRAERYPHELFDFHAEIVKFARNDVLEGVLESLDNQIQLIRRHRPAEPPGSGAVAALEEHMAVLNAIEQRDPHLAGERSVHHLEMVKHRLLNALTPSLAHSPIEPEVADEQD